MIRTILSFFLVILVQLSAFAIDFSYDDFDKAKSAESFIRFEMESTKLGLFTTGFSGVVKKFTINRDLSTTLSFKVVDMDTDNGSRNDKMWEQSFDYKNHPEIKVEIQDAPTVGEHMMKAKIYLRGYSKEFPVKVFVTKTESGLLAKGSAVLKISELEIPDPSIAIAKVRDEINLEFSFLLK